MEVVSLVSAFMGKEPNVQYILRSLPSDVINSSLNVSRLSNFMKSVMPLASTEIFMDLERSLHAFDLEGFVKYSKNS